jgi:hypothetical protein
MKKFVSITGLALVMLLPGARAAEAISLTPSSPELLATTAYNSTIDTAEEWLLHLAITPQPTLLYKSNVSGTTGLGADSGTYASSYKTLFSNTLADPSGALISYLGGSAIGCGTCYLLVKDGNQIPAHYLFSLAGWNGTESITLTAFWPEQGAISNVAIYSGVSTQVPEPATLLLLSLGALGLAARGRRAHPAS